VKGTRGEKKKGGISLTRGGRGRGSSGWRKRDNIDTDFPPLGEEEEITYVRKGNFSVRTRGEA